MATNSNDLSETEVSCEVVLPDHIAERLVEPDKTAEKKQERDQICCSQCRAFDSPLFKCSQCKSVLYCSTLCQKMNWKLHKSTCKAPIIGISSSMEFDEIQRIVDGCAKGSVVQFAPGLYMPSVQTREVDAQRNQRQSDGSLGVGEVSLPVSLIIKKAITLIGASTPGSTEIGEGLVEESTTHFPFGIIVHPAQEKTIKGGVQGGNLVLSNLRIGADVQIKDNCFQRIKMTNVQIDAIATRIPGYVLRVDALKIGNCSGEGIFLDGCIIHGGWDGIDNSGRNNRLFIKNSKIRFAGCRGIFSNSHFLLEDSEVTNCGSYGIKDRAGLTKRGTNNIQPGPWDEENPENVGAAGWKEMTSTLFGRRREL